MLLIKKAAIREALRRLTAPAGGKRVIITAYIGSNPLEYIPEPSGAEVYCADNPVGTDPDGVQALLEAGAKVWFVSHLHAKLYWSSKLGALIGSPNLSTNAFGDEGLFETLYEARDIEIKSVLRDLHAHSKPREVTPIELEQFRKRVRKASGKLPEPAQRSTKEAPTFAEWLDQPFRRPFSILVVNHFDAPELTAREWAAVEKYNEERNTVLEGRDVEFVTISRPVVKIPENGDVLFIQELKNGRLSAQDAGWIISELQTVSKVGRGGAGRRTRFIQVSPRRGLVPFQPSGKLLQDTFNRFYEEYPDDGTVGRVFAPGSRNERALLRIGKACASEKKSSK